MDFCDQLLAAPVRAARAIGPAVGMKAADQGGAGCFAIAIGQPVVVFAACADRGARGGNIAKSQLRSQNMLLAELAMPTRMVSFPQQIVGRAKRILGTVHGDHPGERSKSSSTRRLQFESVWINPNRDALRGGGEYR